MTLLNKAIRGSRLISMLDDEVTHFELDDSPVKPRTLSYEKAHAFLERKTRKLRESETLPTESKQQPLMLANSASPHQSSRRRNPRTPERVQTPFRTWCNKHPGICVKCERPGHLSKECRNPKPINSLGSDNPLRTENSNTGSAGAYAVAFRSSKSPSHDERDLSAIVHEVACYF